MVILAAALASAATLGALPTQIEASIDAGRERTVQVTVHSGYAYDLALVPRVFELGQDAGGYAFMAPGTLARSAATWCEPVDAVVPLPAKGDAAVDVRVRVPRDAAGGYSAVILLDAVSPDDPTAALARLAVPVLVDTGGTAKVDVLDVSVVPPSASTPLVVRVRAYNAGGAHATARESAVIVDGAGAVVGRTPGSRTVRVLPGMSAVLEDRWAIALKPGDYRVMAWLDGDGRVTEATFRVP